MELVRCRYCPGYVVFVETVQGNVMPLNPDPDEAGNVVYTLDGEEAGPVRVLTKDELAAPPTRKRYKAHFATCPYSRHARKGAVPAARARTQELFDQETRDMEKPKQ